MFMLSSSEHFSGLTYTVFMVNFALDLIDIVYSVMRFKFFFRL